jgi:hypothetical protein
MPLPLQQVLWIGDYGSNEPPWGRRTSPKPFPFPWMPISMQKPDHDLITADHRTTSEPKATNTERQSKKTESRLSGLGALCRGHLLAVLVVADARRRSTVAAALAGSDTICVSVSKPLLESGERDN